MNRQEILSALKNKTEVSVLIIGGGVNGIGTFRDLALNDVDVLLVERADFCSGASSASSHMAHGGIRYLENGEFRLVREAVQERNLLIQNAPHMVKPLPTTIPIFKRFPGILNAPLKFFGRLKKPSERASLVIKLGLMMYDAYTSARNGNRAVPKHKFHSRKRSLETWKYLNPEIFSTAVYYDGAILQPERLAVAGNSGGGTQSAYLAALEPRLAVPAPSCYLTRWRELWVKPAPQDAEQNFFGFPGAGLDFGDFDFFSSGFFGSAVPGSGSSSLA